MVLVPSWNENVAMSTEFDKSDHLPTAHDGIEEYLEQLSFSEEDMSIDGVLEHKMADIQKVLDLAGWTTECRADMLVDTEPIGIVRSQGEWNSVVKKKQQEIIDDRTQNVPSTGKTNKKTSRRNSIERVKVVDKKWLE